MADYPQEARRRWPHKVVCGVGHLAVICCTGVQLTDDTRMADLWVLSPCQPAERCQGGHQLVDLNKPAPVVAPKPRKFRFPESWREAKKDETF